MTAKLAADILHEIMEYLMHRVVAPEHKTNPGIHVQNVTPVPKTYATLLMYVRGTARIVEIGYTLFLSGA